MKASIRKVQARGTKQTKVLRRWFQGGDSLKNTNKRSQMEVPSESGKTKLSSEYCQAKVPKRKIPIERFQAKHLKSTIQINSIQKPTTVTLV